MSRRRLERNHDHHNTKRLMKGFKIGALLKDLAHSGEREVKSIPPDGGEVSLNLERFHQWFRPPSAAEGLKRCQHCDAPSISGSLCLRVFRRLCLDNHLCLKAPASP